MCALYPLYSFVLAYHLKMIFLQLEHIFPRAGHFLISLMFLATIFAFDHELGSFENLFVS